jgi:hypothetical protein
MKRCSIEFSNFVRLPETAASTTKRFVRGRLAHALIHLGSSPCFQLSLRRGMHSLY